MNAKIQRKRQTRRSLHRHCSDATRDLRTPLAKARDKWLASEEGRRCASSDMLKRPEYSQYLENRLVTAFLAGVRWAEKSKHQNGEVSGRMSGGK